MTQRTERSSRQALWPKAEASQLLPNYPQLFTAPPVVLALLQTEIQFARGRSTDRRTMLTAMMLAPARPSGGVR
jgi:hypothetical protein